MRKQQFIYKTWKELLLKVSFFPATATEAKDKTILYFHGGGFLFGDREDLPEAYLALFLKNGFHVLAFDYPLAPETPLREIVHCLEAGVHWFSENYQSRLNLLEPGFFLFGRSAGGCLASILTANHYQHQLGLIRFYGYHHFDHEEFVLPSPFYNHYPKVPPLTAQQLIQNQPTVVSGVAERFPLYLSARQYGNWLSYLGPKLNELTVNDKQLEQFPPVFMAHCRKDPDVPIVSSQQMAAAVKQCTFLELDRIEHDFDREKNPTATDIYQKLLDWLEEHIRNRK
ncbi:alpha/beta hydrolase [Enterococcus sp. AZ196]|uniref:alpha/beta hydrolase n=1 Tax=Enterococcus sp. AZ196 TaxID=2774659 RepID=UPI003D2B5695